ncbi:hypothetical protein HQQ94_00515 [Shewanella sp. VB17]|uniref:hypothetical protein n=1 Tax=Shewanella sp. VB17 TaxID=2739432 RepID=UPI001566324F|nr:hypothetical protein [Shewanella sp. VB17]NRD71758.1 hypothetical protein [Shewanella sp. VB17]
MNTPLNKANIKKSGQNEHISLPETDNQDIHTQKEDTSHTAGSIILANIHTRDLINTQGRTFVSQLVGRIQNSANVLAERIQNTAHQLAKNVHSFAPNLVSHNKIQLVLAQGKLKGTESTITLQNNQPIATLAHSGQHTAQLKKMHPELFEKLPRSLKTTPSNTTHAQANKPALSHLMDTGDKPAELIVNNKRYNNIAQENTHTPNQAINQLSNTPGNIILTNIKTNEPINTQLHNLVSQLVERVQIVVPNLANQNSVQLVLDQGKLKGTEITITLQNNQLLVTLAHSGQHTELLQKMHPELLERLQRINTDQQVRIVTMSHEQHNQHSGREQGHQQESNQKSRILDYWLEEQENA